VRGHRGQSGFRDHRILRENAAAGADRSDQLAVDDDREPPSLATAWVTDLPAADIHYDRSSFAARLAALAAGNLTARAFRLPMLDSKTATGVNYA
jgi:hypothetical protein